MTPDELDAFGRVVAAWAAVGGRKQRLDPEAGVGAAVLARIRDIGEQAMCDRIAGLRLDPSGYWPAALEGRGLDARGNPRPALTIEAVARAGKPGDWLSERQAAGAQARLEAQDKAPRDWRPTLEAWSTAERHPGLDNKADWVHASAAAYALGARGDWTAVCAWLRDPAHREAVAAALGAPPVEQDAPAGADAWADMLPRMKSPSRMLAPWQPRGPRLAADDAEHERRATAWRGGLWMQWCGASDDAQRREIAGLWRAAYAEAVTA